MSEARIDRIANENNTGGPVLSGITTFSGQNYFVPPRGTTAERPSDAPVGSLRFNTDSAHLEYYDGLQWLELEAFNVELGVNGALGNRGVFGGGFIGLSPSSLITNIIEYITISTLGNAIDFGDLTIARYFGNGAAASSTRGLFFGGRDPSIGGYNTIDYITFSSTGNAQDFGDTIAGTNTELPAAFSSSTRAIRSGGGGGSGINVIDYVTIASLGDSVDFGDLVLARRRISGCSSTTRGIIGGGNVQSPSSYHNIIEYVTISSTGNTIDFGDFSAIRATMGACSNATRGLFAGGSNPSYTNQIDFITISTTGNAQDFGDLTQTRIALDGCSSSTRGVFGGGYYSPSVEVNTIDYVSIVTTGNAQDFGDLSNTNRLLASCSNGHGGL